MPLQKTILKAGVNRENTRYTNEGGWYECDKIRFRQGTPEKIGGWTAYSSSAFLGVCRSLWAWVTMQGQVLIGIGTNLFFYVMQGGIPYDITPIRYTVTLVNPFTATNGSHTLTVHSVAHGAITGDYVLFSGASIAGLGGTITAPILTGQFQITYVDADNYTITASVAANATDAAGSPGGGTVVTQYMLTTGPAYESPLTGWGAGPWGYGPWGTGAASVQSLQLWNQYNFGENLLYGPSGGGIYYWRSGIGVVASPITVSIASPAVVTYTGAAALVNGAAIMLESTGALPTGLAVGVVYFVKNLVGLTFNLALTPSGASINTTGSQSGTQSISPRGINLTAMGDAGTPLYQNHILVSDSSRFILVFGTNDLNSTVLDPMLIRWSAQEDFQTWYPAVTNQAGSIRLSHGSKIHTAIQTRQEVVVFTDQAVYSLQYVGPPYVWQVQLLSENVSINNANCVALSSGVVYWMGLGKFYMYDGRVQTLNCDLRKFVFDDFSSSQTQQVHACANEEYNEIWWYYCSANSTTIDRYVVYNYMEQVWYYGTMSRTASFPAAPLPLGIAATYNGNIITVDSGIDDNETGTPAPIEAYISSSEFDINDGHNFGFVWRVLPDLTFSGSTAGAPQVTMTLYPMQNAGSGTSTPGSSTVTKGSTYNITEEFTGQIYTRVRGRQLIFEVRSTGLGTTWQLGAPRIDIRPDGRR